MSKLVQTKDEILIQKHRIILLNEIKKIDMEIVANQKTLHNYKYSELMEDYILSNTKKTNKTIFGWRGEGE